MTIVPSFHGFHEQKNDIMGRMEGKDSTGKGMALAIAAASFYALSAPGAKLLLEGIGPVMMAGLLYLGAGTGMSLIYLVSRDRKEEKLTRKELPYAVMMILLDIAAPILVMYALLSVPSENVALLNNTEIVATTLIAAIVYKEHINGRLWAGIALITAAAVMISLERNSLSFSRGSILVLLASLCWGFENNATRMMSSKSPMEIVILKGLFSGSGAIVIALLDHEAVPAAGMLVSALILGFVSYGLSVYLYVYAQRFIGAARTSACYAVNPFIGAFLSLLLFRTALPGMFFIALAVMALGTFLVSLSSRG